MKDFGISDNLEEIKKISEYSFKRKVKIKAKEFALNYLLDKKMTHSKMDELMYTELKLQNYLRCDEIPVHEAKNLYRFRVKVANFRENFKEKYRDSITACPLCYVQPDTQGHSLQCVQVKMMVTIEGKYTEIFRGKILIKFQKHSSTLQS